MKPKRKKRKQGKRERKKNHIFNTLEEMYDLPYSEYSRGRSRIWILQAASA
jgi:hypothetical protein